MPIKYELHKQEFLKIIVSDHNNNRKPWYIFDQLKNFKFTAQKTNWITPVIFTIQVILPIFKFASIQLQPTTKNNFKLLVKWLTRPNKIYISTSKSIPVWWPGLKNSPTVTHACCKRRLKWVPSAWAYSWATLSPGVIHTETWSCRLGAGRTIQSHKKVTVMKPYKGGGPGPDLRCRAIWWWWRWHPNQT
jgi:hypothetical protein